MFPRNWELEARRQCGIWFVARTVLHIYNSVIRIPPYWSSGNWPFPSASSIPTALIDEGVVLPC